MLNFDRQPPQSDTDRPLPLKRTPTLGRLRAMITSPNLIGIHTHFFGGHTVPHEEPECKACIKGVPYRWHGWVSAIQAANRLHFIFEFTAQAGEVFQTYFEAHQTLRGCIFDAERMHHRRNGRVILQVKPGDLAQLALPEPPDLEACLRIIWQLPAEPTTEATKKNGQRALHVNNADHFLADRLGLPAPKKTKAS